jgi:hypothetical protein
MENKDRSVRKHGHTDHHGLSGLADNYGLVQLAEYYGLAGF